MLAGHGPTSRVVCVPSETLWVKAKFSFVSYYQLRITSELGMGTCIPFCSQYRDSIRHRTMQALCMLPWSLCVHMFVGPAMLGSPCLFHILCSLWLLQLVILPPLPQGSLIPEQRELMETSHSGLSVPKSLICTHCLTVS